MARKFLPTLMVVVVVAVAAFGAGYWMRGGEGLHPSVMTADCYSSATGGTCQGNGTAYGFRSTLMWTDSAGVFHSDGWPDCLPHMQQVSVRIAAGTVWVGDSGTAEVLWVDCQNRP